MRKRVVPVLLDDTPLTAELAPIHGIDLRGAIQHTPKPSDKRRVRTLLAVAAVTVAIALFGAWLQFRPAEPIVRFPISGPTRTEVSLVGNAILTAGGALSQYSRNELDSLDSLDTSNPRNHIVIESRGSDRAMAFWNADRVREYFSEHRGVPRDSVFVLLNVSKEAAGTSNTEVFVRVVHDRQFLSGESPVAAKGPSAAALLTGLAVFVLITVLLVRLGLWLWRSRRRKRIVREFAPYLGNEAP